MKIFIETVQRPPQGGFALLEALIAIVIFSIGVLGLVGIQATMVRSTSDAQYRATATYIAQQRIGEIWANPAAGARLTFRENEADIGHLLPDGTRTTTIYESEGEKTLVTVTVAWRSPGDPAEASTHQVVLNARIVEGVNDDD